MSLIKKFKDLPFRAIRRVFYIARRRFFTVNKPKKDGYTVCESVESVRERLGKDSYEPAWPYSYRYMGEDMNCRRYFLDPEKEYPHRQIHIRGFEVDDGVQLLAHEEPAPKHHPKIHLSDSDMENAVPWLKEMWDNPSLDPRSF